MAGIRTFLMPLFASLVLAPCVWGSEKGEDDQFHHRESGFRHRKTSYTKPEALTVRHQFNASGTHQAQYTFNTSRIYDWLFTTIAVVEDESSETLQDATKRRDEKLNETTAASKSAGLNVRTETGTVSGYPSLTVKNVKTLEWKREIFVPGRRFTLTVHNVNVGLIKGDKLATFEEQANIYFDTFEVVDISPAKDKTDLPKPEQQVESKQNETYLVTSKNLGCRAVFPHPVREVQTKIENYRSKFTSQKIEFSCTSDSEVGKLEYRIIRRPHPSKIRMPISKFFIIQTALINTASRYSVTDIAGEPWGVRVDNMELVAGDKILEHSGVEKGRPVSPAKLLQSNSGKLEPPYFFAGDLVYEGLAGTPKRRQRRLGHAKVFFAQDSELIVWVEPHDQFMKDQSVVRRKAQEFFKSIELRDPFK